MLYVEKCRIRKSGTSYIVDLHITVPGEISVKQGHDVAHNVQDRLIAGDLRIADVTVHVEPDCLAASS